jgi:hypothetical protein
MIPDTFTLSNLKKAVNNPSLFSKEAKRLITGIQHGYRYGEGIDLMSKDWDNLIILDACRFDYFSDLNYFEGELQKVTSKGKASWPFVKHNYLGRELHDTVSVTGNPFYNQLAGDNVFYTIKSSLGDIAQEDVSINHWHPNTIQEQAVEAHEEFPNKRLIIHFMQPHQPFIGSVGEELHDRIEGTKFEKTNLERDYIPAEAVENSLISIEEYRGAYKENLQIVLEYVEELLNKLDGKSIITADHGELLGERILGRRRYGHDHTYESPYLREVPWFVINSDSRREIVSEKPIDDQKLDSDTLDKHLEALGYK